MMIVTTSFINVSLRIFVCLLFLLCHWIPEDSSVQNTIKLICESIKIQSRSFRKHIENNSDQDQLFSLVCLTAFSSSVLYGRIVHASATDFKKYTIALRSKSVISFHQKDIGEAGPKREAEELSVL